MLIVRLRYVVYLLHYIIVSHLPFPVFHASVGFLLLLISVFPQFLLHELLALSLVVFGRCASNVGAEAHPNPTDGRCASNAGAEAQSYHPYYSQHPQQGDHPAREPEGPFVRVVGLC